MKLRVDNPVTMAVQCGASAWLPCGAATRVSLEMGFHLEMKAITGPLRGKIITCADDGQIVFGRDCDGQEGELPQDDPCASRRHFLLEIEAPLAWVRDLGSTHGTFINGRVCRGADRTGDVPSRVELQSGDLIQAGQTSFEVTLTTEEASSQTGDEAGDNIQASRKRERATSSRSASGGPTNGSLAIRPAPRRGDFGPGGLILHNRLGPPQIEGFDIRRSLGRNALGPSFLCQHRLEGRLCVIKLVRTSQDLGPGLPDLLEEACGNLCSLSHENVVRVQDYGVTRFGPEGWGLCLEMEYCEGGNANQAAAEKGGRLPAHEVHDILGDCLAGLAYMHTQGIVHGNLKPTNLLFGQAQGRRCAKLADFALLPALQRVLTAAGTSAGDGTDVLRFGPPELPGSPHLPSQTADTWGLGALLYHLLTGHHPWAGSMHGAAGLNPLQGRLVPIREHFLLVPNGLDGLLDLIDRALATSPEERFPSAIEMWNQFQRLPRPPAVRVEFP